MIALLLSFQGLLYGVIPYGGNDYREERLPVSFSGGTPDRVVVVGNNLTITNNAQGSTYIVNGGNTEIKNETDLPLTNPGDNIYFIYYSPKNTQGTCTISGTDDWTLTTHSLITVPFSKSDNNYGFFKTAMELNSVTTSGADMILVNNVDFTSSSPAIPERHSDGFYYIYYGPPASGTISLDLDHNPTAITLPFSKTGTGEYYYSYSTTDVIDSLISTDLDYLFINNTDYTNQTVKTMPVTVNGSYYIYYEASAGSPSLNIYPIPRILDLKVFLEGGL